MFEKLAQAIVKKEKGKGRVNILIMDDKAIHKLNKKYRKKDKPTDVLSFHMGEEGTLGDIAISKETTKRNAKKYGVSYSQESKRLIIHGTLHLLGYDHGKEMRNAEKIYQKL